MTLGRIIDGVRPDVAETTIYDPQKGREPTFPLILFLIFIVYRVLTCMKSMNQSELRRTDAEGLLCLLYGARGGHISNLEFAYL